MPVASEVILMSKLRMSPGKKMDFASLFVGCMVSWEKALSTMTDRALDPSTPLRHQCQQRRQAHPEPSHPDMQPQRSARTKLALRFASLAVPAPTASSVGLPDPLHASPRCHCRR
eukprot:scaffold374_cov380-Prasinococcus_capsulatus_cf.AAC.4